MAKFALSLAVVVAVLVEVALCGYAAGSNLNQLGGGRPGFGLVGFGSGECSATNGIIPDPKSGCCGRHAGADGGSQGGNNNGNDDSDSEGNGYDPINPGNTHGPGNNDDGNGMGGGGIFNPGDIWGGLGGNGIGDGNGMVGGGIFNPGDIWGGLSGNGIGDGNGMGGGGIFNPGDIWGGLGGNGIGEVQIGGGNPWQFSEEHRYKTSADKNASNVAPDKFITAGRATGIAQYPWLVHLQVKVVEGIVGCGGSLVSSRHVITAAHCLAHDIRQYEDVNIVMAEYNTQTYPTDCVGRQCIKNVVMHPDKIAIHNGYQSGMLNDDIGMMRLRGAAPYNDYIRPICLPSFNINSARNEGTPLTITGWGQTGNGQASPIKLHTQVQLVAPRTCMRHYPDLTESKLCAAGRSGQDTCMGDSGGPIMAEHEGNFFLVGLVSGKIADAGCGSPIPTIYTNVFSYMNWIQNFMRD